MIKHSFALLFFLTSVCIFTFSNAQTEKPIGYWNSFLPYNTALGAATDGKSLFTITNQSFFIFKDRQVMEPFSKVSGMSDEGMQSIAYDAATSYIVLAYSNGNIDLFKNNTFYNIPDFKIKTVTGNKAVYDLFTENGMAYLCTSIGIIVIDLTNQNINETYQFIVNSQTIPVKSFCSSRNYFYATTTAGLFRADKHNPELQNFASWTKVSNQVFKNITNINDTLFLSSPHTVYALLADTLYPVYKNSSIPKDSTILHVDKALNSLLVCEMRSLGNGSYVKKMDMNFNIVDSIVCPGIPMEAVQLQDSTIWVTDALYGLENWYKNQINPFSPPGPTDALSFDIYANNKKIWVAHGGFNDMFRPLYNSDGISNFNNNSWTAYRQWVYPPFWDSVGDFTSIVVDETDGTLYAGSFTNGIFVLHPDKSYEILKWNTFDASSVVYGTSVVGEAFDNYNNLWVTLYGAQHELCVREKTSGNWYKYNVNVPRTIPFSAGPLVVDDYQQVWYACYYGGGLIGYNTNGTLNNASDDNYYHFTTGVGSGNLPSNNVMCVAKDKSGNIWVGTDNGIGIMYEPSLCISQHCDFSIPIVQFDQFAGYLFAGENVKTICIDGANRKWVGTDNGVWLLSSDVVEKSKIVYRFTKDNSPLPSNHIQKISRDNVTGDVYIGTDQGMVSFRSTDTEGGETNKDVLVFPDPVPAGYTGTIAIKGLVANADVRITDISGQLVYHTIAYGGQAIWNGLDYKGRRPQTGVYLIYVTNTDNGNAGSQTYVGKLVFIQ